MRSSSARNWASVSRLVLCLPDDLLGNVIEQSTFEERLREKRLLPAGRLCSKSLERLLKLKAGDTFERAPSELYGAAYLADGAYLSRVVFIRQERVLQWLLPFWRCYVRPESVAEIAPSPFQFPRHCREWIWGVGETSMGALSFRITMRDGKRFGCRYGGANDFVTLPTPYIPSEIERIEVGTGLARKEKVVIEEPDFVWCVYEE